MYSESEIKARSPALSALTQVVEHLERIMQGPSAFAMSTVAGSGEKGLVDGRAGEACFNFPTGMAMLGDRILVADKLNSCIREVDPGGNVRTLVGLAGCGYQDGPLADAQLNMPMGLCVTREGAVLVADTNNHMIRRIEGNRITAIVGTDEGMTLPHDIIQTSKVGGHRWGLR
jgi:hypothetical protein